MGPKYILNTYIGPSRYQVRDYKDLGFLGFGVYFGHKKLRMLCSTVAGSDRLYLGLKKAPVSWGLWRLYICTYTLSGSVGTMSVPNYVSSCLEAAGTTIIHKCSLNCMGMAATAVNHTWSLFFDSEVK